MSSGYAFIMFCAQRRRTERFPAERRWHDAQGQLDLFDQKRVPRRSLRRRCFRMKKVKRACHSLGGLFVRNATALGKESLRLELSLSDTETRDFLRHLNKLGDSDSFVVEVPAGLLEQMSSPEEMGTREHKLAMLQGNCINLKFAIAPDRSIEIIDASSDSSCVRASCSDHTGASASQSPACRPSRPCTARTNTSSRNASRRTELPCRIQRGSFGSSIKRADF